MNREFRTGRPGAALLFCSLMWAGLLPTLSGCGNGEQPQPRPNVLLISLDTCRADRLGAYGYRCNTSPFLDRLAREGSLFQLAFINTHGTTPSHTTILSGLYQESHRVEYDGVSGMDSITPLPRGVLLLPDALRRAGYEALAVTDGGRLSRVHGFDMGSDIYDGKGGGVLSGTRKLVDYLEQRYRQPDREREAVGESGHSQHGPGPAFVFYHTYAIHAPYAPPDSWAGYYGRQEGDFEPSIANLQRHVNSARRTLSEDELEQIATMYDAGILYTDGMIQWLFARLEQIGFLDHCLVVVTSDHGEELGEHGGLSHRSLLFEELIRVPLIFAGAGVPQGRVFQNSATSLDIGPTILARLGLEPSGLMTGRDLFDPDPGAHPREMFSQYGKARYAIRTERWKLIESPESGRLQLYDLRQDPAESRNLAAKRSDIARRLQERLHAWKAGQRPFATVNEAGPVQADEETVDQLRALGYLDGDVPSPPGLGE